MLRIDANLIITIVNILVLYVLVRKFLFKPVREVLEKRDQEIKSEYEKAEELKASSLELKKKYEECLKAIDEEKKTELDKSRLQASEEYETIINNANKKAEQIISEATLKAEKETETKRKEMQQQMALLVAEAAFKIAQSKENSENDRKLYDVFLSEGNEGK